MAIVALSSTYELLFIPLRCRPGWDGKYCDAPSEVLESREFKFRYFITSVA